MFLESSYQQVIVKNMAQLRKREAGRSFGDLAKFMRIEHSYLSKVIHQKAHFNSDQLYLVCNYFNFTEDEQNYMFLLLEHDRCYIPERKTHLKNRIRAIQKKKLRTEAYLQKADTIKNEDVDHIEIYYTKPIHQIVHICLGIPQFANNQDLLASQLNLSRAYLETIIRNLIKMQLVERKNGKLSVTKASMHLSKDSQIYKHWIQQMRLLTLQKIASDQADDCYNFSVIFSCDENTKNKIHEAYFEFVKKVETLVCKAPKENVFQLNFDFFPWPNSPTAANAQLS